MQVIVAGRLGTTFSFGDGKVLQEKARNAEDFFVVEGAGHYEMYDTPGYVDQAVGVWRRSSAKTSQRRTGAC